MGPTPENRTALLAGIRAMIDAPLEGAVEELERVLTDGYAHALALEAERLRIERRLGEVAAEIAEGDEAAVGELARLSTRLRDANGDLVELRDVLTSLRDRYAQLRAA